MRILIIAPYFAPSSEVPSVRMVSLSEYLIEKDHKVSVLCYSNKMLLTMYDPKELSTKVPAGVTAVGFDIQTNRIPFLSDILQGYQFAHNLGHYVNIEDYDAVFMTCGPYFTLKAVPAISKKSGIPCVLDFRDLGALNYRPQLKTEKISSQWWKKPIKAFYRKAILKREKAAVDCAAHIIAVSAIDKKKMAEAYRINDARISVATNGFDEKKLGSVISHPKDQNYIVGAVFGKFMYYSKERAISLLSGIQKMNENGYSVKLLHIGRQYEWIADAIRENNIDPACYDSQGLKEYSEGMSLLGSADFFVVEDTSPDDVGTKIYDYIFWNKPIIAAVPKDIPLAKLVGSFEHGYVCDTQEEVERAVRDVVANRYDCLDPHIDTMSYSRRHQNEVMEQCLIDVVSGR